MAKRKEDIETAQPVEEQGNTIENGGDASSVGGDVYAVPNGDVLAVLKHFPDVEEAYVSKFGCVYTKDTPAVQRGSAQLYKNPYFNH